jgi:hypothetical protein
VLSRFFGDTGGFTSMVVDHIPDPEKNAATKIAQTWTGHTDSPLGKSLVQCDPSGPLVIQVCGRSCIYFILFCAKEFAGGFFFFSFSFFFFFFSFFFFLLRLLGWDLLNAGMRINWLRDAKRSRFSFFFFFYFFFFFFFFFS